MNTYTVTIEVEVQARDIETAARSVVDDVAAELDTHVTFIRARSTAPEHVTAPEHGNPYADPAAYRERFGSGADQLKRC